MIRICAIRASRKFFVVVVVVAGLFLSLVVAGDVGIAVTAAEPPLHAAIDALVAARADGPLAGPASDAEFCRRVWLDLAGSIPPAEETKKFLADAAPDKRTRLIDRLLDSPDYARRMQQLVGVMWLDRRDGKAIDDDAWNRWLREAFAANRPWDALVRELFSADGTDDKTRPAIRFFVDGGRADSHLLTQDVARIFLGVNWQCSQCHDHPVFEDYKQAHYFGLYAFLNATKPFTDKQSKTFLTEGVTKAKVEFVSVFMPDDKRATGPKLLEMSELELPPFVAGREFATPPKDGRPGVPKFRPRGELAERLVSPTNRQFARNAVNRFWFQMMGRGLVHPLDLHHAANPPSHPELLERLTDEFVAHGHDVRWLLRELALSAVYQRSSQAATAADAAKPDRYQRALAKPLSAEQMARSLAQATGRLEELDAAPIPAETKFTYKDYLNGRLDPPANWKDVQIVFHAAFGHPAGQAEVDFRPSVEQALFLTNDRLLAQWLAVGAGGLVDRLLAVDSTDRQVDEAYLRILSRPPSDEERAELAAFLKSAADRSDAVVDLCRALLTSAEFRLNR